MLMKTILLIFLGNINHFYEDQIALLNNLKNIAKSKLLSLPKPLLILFEGLA
jgi:hypothetical protein